MQNVNNFAALMLPALQGLALGIGFVILGWMLAGQRRRRLLENASPARPSAHEHGSARFKPSASLTASGETERMASQHAGRCPADLKEKKFCAGDREFFISPRVHGWV